MPTRYAIQMIDRNGTAIEPGFGGSTYESDTPLPLPSRGDIIESFDREFIVDRLTYEYTHDEKTNDLVVAVTVQCHPAP
jgi:hypothetical protein